MSWIKRLVSSLRVGRLERQLDQELEFHLAMRTREKTAGGATAEEARREALQRFGSVTRAKEACRDESTVAWVAGLRQDLRYAARNLRKNPGFAAAAVACLAMGIGANAAIFSFVNAFLFPVLPPRVVLVQRAQGGGVSYPELRDWQNWNRVFDQVMAYSPGERLTIGRGAESEHVLGESVTGNYFQTLGVVPAAGRLFAADDEARPLAVLGYRFWRERFLGDPAIAGKIIWINHELYTIAGVAPASFQGMLAPWSTDVWVTVYLHRDVLADRQAGGMAVAARLRSAVSERQAAAAMNSLDAELARQHPDAQRRRRDPLAVVRRSGLSGSPVWGVFLAMAALLMCVAGILFVIACANVAGLLMARAAVRRREILIRLSLGASRVRLVRQLLTESLLLGLGGAVGGIAIAYAAGDALAGLLPQSISGGFRFQHGIDAHVLGFSVALAVMGVAIFGLLPALRASDQSLADAGRTQSASGWRSPRLRPLLIVAQVAASVLVLATAGVFVRSFQKALAADSGFDAGHLLTIKLDLREMQYPRGRVADFYRRLRSRVAGLPGVDSVSLADTLPLGDEHTVRLAEEGTSVATAMVDSLYFRTMGIRLVRGREPGPEERHVIVVNETLARRVWPGQDPVGRMVRLGADGAPWQVIGVTATGKYWSLNEPARPFMYRISGEQATPVACLAIRTEGPPQALARAIGREIERVNPDLPAMKVETEEVRLREWLGPQRAAAVLLSILGLAALGLAITGLYALLAQLVAQRAPEIAVRVALGASRARVARMLLGRSGLLILAGAVAGIAASAATDRLLGGLAGEVHPLDAAMLAGIVILLAVVGAAATLLPAWRAVRIDPATALRAE